MPEIIKKISFERDEPLFALDIGHSNMKVMQLELSDPTRPSVLGYGISGKYIVDTLGPGGEIAKPEQLAESMMDLFKNRLVGAINTQKVACTIPTAHTFSRLMTLPNMTDKEITEAVHLEIEQYVPMPPESLYIDYEVAKKSDTEIDVLMVATPKKIIDSFMYFLESMSLTPVALEPTMNASARLFKLGGIPSNEPTVLVDYGSTAIDIAIYENALFVNSTIAGGSEAITEQISKEMKVSLEEAFVIKCLNGIGETKNKDAVLRIIKPQLESLIREIQKIMRYFNERTTKDAKTINRILALGGGSNMPGFIQYLSKEINMPVQIVDPWASLDFGELRQLSDEERTVYLTVCGMALLNPAEAFIQ